MLQPVETRMLQAQMLNILEHARIAYISISIAQLIVVTGLWPAYSHELLLLWLAAIHTTILYRFLICRSYSAKDLDRKNLQRLKKHLFIAILCNGILWGTLAWFLPSEWNIYSFIILLPILGISAAAMNLSAILPIYLALVIPIILQVIGALVFFHVDDLIIAALFFIFYVGVVGVAIATSKMLKHTYQLQFDLQSAKGQAEDATLLRDKFVALVSHDIRSPLMGVHNCLKMLAPESQYTFTSEQRNELISTTEKTTKGLLLLTEKLLDISILKSGQLEISKRLINLAELASQVCDSFAFQADKKEITLINKLSPQALIFADAGLLAEALSNLISNAIKFTEEGGVVSIYSSSENYRVIYVEDTGVGMESGYINHIFDDKVKTTSLGTSSEAGTGLGLPYCFDIIEAHHGTIEVQSVENKGTIFSITLPEIVNSILLVDDQEVQRSIIKKNIQTIVDVDIIEAEHGIEALNAMSKTKPALIITDIQMDQMDGLELIKKIKMNDNLKNIPVIVASAVGHVPISADKQGQSIQDQLLALGVSSYITKPVDPARLQTLIQELIR